MLTEFSHMGAEAIIVSIILLLGVVLFISERFSVDVVALGVMILLVITGVLTPGEGLSGFSNPATITVAGMFVVSAALFKTGAIDLIGVPLANIFRKNYKIGLLSMMLTVGIISAFINNTPVVAIFIPIIVKAAKDANISVSKLLIPLSFASIFGGTCTLIGTSTNILVSGIAEDHGLEPFGIFQLAPVGIVIFIIGIAYMMFIGIRLLPDRDDRADSESRYRIGDYLADIIVLPNSPNVGKRLMDAPLLQQLDLEIIEVTRGEDKFIVPPVDFVLQANDRLRVRCDLNEIKKIKDRIKVQILSTGDEHSEEDRKIHSDTMMIELVITANSEFEGKTLSELEFKRRYRAVPLAIQHRNEIRHERLNDIKLKAGDIILVEVKAHRLPKFKRMQSRQESPFVMLSEEGISEFKPSNFALVLGTIATVVTLAALRIMPISIGAMAASVFLILTGCISSKDTYQAIDWKIIFLLAGALSIGKAMENSGLSDQIAGQLIHGLGPYGFLAIIGGFYFMTNLFTEFMSNNATAALMAPIAIVAAQSLGIQPLPLLLAVTFAASASFITPLGYQTNTMIYGVGQYRFHDFARTGLLLSFILWITVSLSIYYIIGIEPI